MTFSSQAYRQFEGFHRLWQILISHEPIKCCECYQTLDHGKVFSHIHVSKIKADSYIELDFVLLGPQRRSIFNLWLPYIETTCRLITMWWSLVESIYSKVKDYYRVTSLKSNFITDRYFKVSVTFWAVSP